jgi:type IV secretory pathway component VirB8
MVKRNVAYAVAALVMALTLAAGIEVCTLLPYLNGRPQ